MRSTSLRTVVTIVAIFALSALAWRFGDTRLKAYRYNTSWERAQALVAQGSWAEAADALHTAVDNARRLGSVDERYTQALLLLADANEALGHYAEAYPLYFEVMREYRTRHGASSVEVASMLAEMGRVQERLDQPETALGIYRQAVVVWQETAGSDHPDIAPTLIGLGRTLAQLGQFAESKVFYEWAIGVQRQALGATHPSLAPLQREFAIVLRETGNDELAERFETHADTIEAPSATNR